MKIKHSWKLALIFSITVFLILSFTMLLMGVTTMLLIHFGIINNRHWEIVIIIAAFISILVGTVLSRFASRKVLSAIIEISNATIEVAKGNYNIQINEENRAEEISTMAHNFNIMTKELQNTELFRNDFIENVSHEFKTPLAAINGYVTLLQNKSLSIDKRESYIEKILFNTKRLSSLTGNILLLSRLENQEIAPKKQLYALDEQIREILLLFEEEWNSRNINLDIELDTIIYYGNNELLAQVWQNIIGNAFKFVKDNGMIQVTLHQESFYLKVKIHDNGIGMSNDVKNRIYEKFYQGEHSRSVSGNGLGLTLAKRIIDLHDGFIEVHSIENQGSTFTIYLPSSPYD